MSSPIKTPLASEAFIYYFALAMSLSHRRPLSKRFERRTSSYDLVDWPVQRYDRVFSVLVFYEPGTGQSAVSGVYVFGENIDGHLDHDIKFVRTIHAKDVEVVKESVVAKTGDRLMALLEERLGPLGVDRYDLEECEVTV